MTLSPDVEVYTMWEGDRLRVTDMFDIDNDDTDDPFMACTFVAQLPDGKWLAATCRPEDLEVITAVTGERYAFIDT